MNIDIKKYKTIVFDCDGVILNSNKVKVNAYYEVAKRNDGTDAQAQALADHHVKKGSFPRNGKIEYYLREILKQPVTPEAMQRYMQTFEEVLDKALMRCEIAPGLQALKAATPDARWMLISGGDQKELRHIFARRSLNDLSKDNVFLADLFEAGIFGGPDIKDDILAREKASGNLAFPALFVGDSKYDYEAASRAGLDFVFLSDWTEVADWQDFCQSNQICALPHLTTLLKTANA